MGSITLQTAAGTPYATRYVLTGTGSDPDVVLSRAQLITDCKEGPLKAYLQRITSAQWLDIPVDPNVLFHMLLTGATQLAGMSTTFSNSPDEISFAIDADTAVTFEVRFQHSIDR